MALSFQNEAGATAVWNNIEDIKEIVKLKLIEKIEASNLRSDSMDSSGFNYDSLENDIFLDENNALTFPNFSNLSKILQELMVFI